MDHDIGRRDFGKRTAVVLGGLLTGLPAVGATTPRQDRDRSDTRLVLLGLNALARAHQLDYFADGHRGASMVAAHFLCVDNNLDEQATVANRRSCSTSTGPRRRCASPSRTPSPSRRGSTRSAPHLAEGGEVLRQVGHNAIFAMLAIKAFRMIPGAATPQRIDGVCALIRSFTPWHDVEPDPDVDPPPFADAAAASQFILREAMRGDRSVRRVRPGVRRAHADLRPGARRAGGHGRRQVGRELPHRLPQVRDGHAPRTGRPIRNAIPITSRATCGRPTRRTGRSVGTTPWTSGTCSSTPTATTSFCGAPAIPS